MVLLGVDAMKVLLDVAMVPEVREIREMVRVTAVPFTESEMVAVSFTERVGKGGAVVVMLAVLWRDPAEVTLSALVRSVACTVYCQYGQCASIFDSMRPSSPSRSNTRLELLLSKLSQLWKAIRGNCRHYSNEEKGKNRPVGAELRRHFSSLVLA